MKLLIIPKPMFNSEMAVMSYCFRYQKENALINNNMVKDLDGAMNSPCMEVLKMVGLEAVTIGLPIFVPINKFSLLADLENQCNEPPEKVVFLINEKLPPEEPFISKIKNLKALGYRFAAEKIYNYNKMAPVIGLCDFIFISCSVVNFRDITKRLSDIYRHIKFIATDVNAVDLFNIIKYDRFEMFEGKFYSIPITKGQNTISPIKVNYIQLINLSRREDFDINDVAKVVSQDTALSLSLLRLVNSPYMGLTQKIKTINHAVAMLGQKEVRKWITTAVSGLLAGDKPDEITKLSLMRAKLAENLSAKFEMAVHAESLFMMGLFSILDVVLDMPLQEVFKIINVSDKIYDALVNMNGEFAKILEFIYTYETADWNEVSRLMIINNLSSEEIFDAYTEATLWYSSIISTDVEGV